MPSRCTDSCLEVNDQFVLYQLSLSGSQCTYKVIKSMNALQAQQKQSLPMVEYNIWAYLAYVYYPPLYIAGPICTFNAFAWQCRQPSAIQCRQVCKTLPASMRRLFLMLTAVELSVRTRTRADRFRGQRLTDRLLLCSCALL